MIEIDTPNFLRKFPKRSTGINATTRSLTSLGNRLVSILKSNNNFISYSRDTSSRKRFCGTKADNPFP